jgi:hypothetical protein
LWFAKELSPDGSISLHYNTGMSNDDVDFF